MSRVGGGRVPRSFLAIAVVVALAGMVALGAGCGSSKKTTPATSPKTTPKTSASTTPVAPGAPAPIVLQGSGNSTTQIFSMLSGLVIFTLRDSGTGTFTVTLQDVSGKAVSVLSNVNVPFVGSTALGVAAGQYTIKVVSSGAWEVDVNQQVPVNPQFLPIHDSGTAAQVTAFFQSQGGAATVTMTYAGSSPFIVTLLTSGGQTVSTVANATTGPFNGSKTVQLQQGVIYLIDIEAGGPWTLSIQ
jgi:hypothetical protein